MPEARIQKVLADAGVASRRAAEALVAAGRVTVDGVPATVGQRVDQAVQRIAVGGRSIDAAGRHLYLVLDKPAGVTSTVADRHAERTVLELVPEALRRRAGRLYPVGRLDRDSEGLLLLTNDGDWAQRLQHPRYGVEREYAVGLARPLTPEQARPLREGVPLDEGLATLRGLRPATGPELAKMAAAIEPGPEGLRWYRATIAQGWRRQLRRMFVAVGAPVSRLVRVRIGTLRIDGLRAGEVRELTARERDRLGDLGREGSAPTPAGEATPAQRGLVVSLDGPGSSGKSTVGAAAATELGYRFCDTGLLYRALTWLALEREVALEDGAALAGLVAELTLVADADGRLTRVRVGRRDVTDGVHAGRVDRHVSVVARQPEVRAALLPRQREIATAGRIIMAGRDIGTVVLPDADVKIYLEASASERARRRVLEREARREHADYAEILESIRKRDAFDSSRETAPLRRAPDAHVIDSNNLSIPEVLDQVLDLIRSGQREA